MPVAIVALLVMGRDRGAWMAVPALRPQIQLYYDTIALPALTPLAAALIAIPSPWCVVGACVVLAIQQRRKVMTTSERAPATFDASGSGEAIPAGLGRSPMPLRGGWRARD